MTFRFVKVSFSSLKVIFSLSKNVRKNAQNSVKLADFLTKFRIFTRFSPQFRLYAPIKDLKTYTKTDDCAVFPLLFCGKFFRKNCIFMRFSHISIYTQKSLCHIFYRFRDKMIKPYHGDDSTGKMMAWQIFSAKRFASQHFICNFTAKYHFINETSVRHKTWCDAYPPRRILWGG